MSRPSPWIPGRGPNRLRPAVGHSGLFTGGRHHGGPSAGGLRPETLKKYNCFWMVVRIWVHLDRPLRWNERFTVRTWHRGTKGASTYRDFDLICDGVTVGEAVSTWVLADRDTYKLLRMSRLEEFQGHRRRPSVQGQDPPPGAYAGGDDRPGGPRPPLQRHGHQRPRQQHQVRGFCLRRPPSGGQTPPAASSRSFKSAIWTSVTPARPSRWRPRPRTMCSTPAAWGPAARSALTAPSRWPLFLPRRKEP